MEQISPFQALHTGLTLVYGPAGTGKTTLLMQVLAPYLAQGKKALIIDTEQGFSIQRLKQVVGGDDSWTDRLFIVPIKNFQEQEERIRWLVDHASVFDFIGIDTLGAQYRKAVAQDVRGISAQLRMQGRILQQLAKQKPVVVTNQVYGGVSGESTTYSVGGKELVKIFDRVIELKNEPRIFCEHRPQPARKQFTINDAGLFF